jgi:hypothetical protein
MKSEMGLRPRRALWDLVVDRQEKEADLMPGRN